MDDFEKLLKDQTFRPAPPALRGKVLAAAKAAGGGGILATAAKLLFMNTLTKTIVAVVAVVIVAIVVVENISSSPAPAKVEATKPAPVPTTTPVAPPVVQYAPSPQPVADNSAKDSTQAELNALIDDIASTLESGDPSGMAKFAPPDDLAKQESAKASLTPEQAAMQAARAQAMQQAMASPALQQLIQRQVQNMRSLKGQTPELNAAGDRATYKMTTPATTVMTGPVGVAYPEHTETVTFLKIDGKWYLKSN